MRNGTAKKKRVWAIWICVAAIVILVAGGAAFSLGWLEKGDSASPSAHTQAAYPVKSAGENGEERGGELKQPVRDTLTAAVDQNLEGRFSPFTAMSSADRAVADTVTLYALTLDRMASPVSHAISGEIHTYKSGSYQYTGPADVTVSQEEDGTVSYEIKLRDDLVFSDGTPVTADDVIFGIYVCLDPTYEGGLGLSALPIQGLEEYRANMDPLYRRLLLAGRDNTDFSLWSEDVQNSFWETALPAAGEAFAASIIRECVARGYAGKDDPVEAVTPFWGYEVAEGASAADFWHVLEEAYEGDYRRLSASETANASLWSYLDPVYLTGVSSGESAPNVTGVRRVDDHTVRIITTGADASAIYRMRLPIAPLHYYGDKTLYNYEQNRFGFPKGDLRSVREKDGAPLGAGPYVFSRSEDGTVYLDANTEYYKGAPAIAHLRYREVSPEEKITGIRDGTLDISAPVYTPDTARRIAAVNREGEATVGESGTGRDGTAVGGNGAAGTATGESGAGGSVAGGNGAAGIAAGETGAAGVAAGGSAAGAGGTGGAGTAAGENGAGGTGAAGTAAGESGTGETAADGTGAGGTGATGITAGENSAGETGGAGTAAGESGTGGTGAAGAGTGENAAAGIGGSDEIWEALDGPVISARLADHDGYGYVGINSVSVSVGGDPASAASKSLRKALAVIIAAYREEGIEAYYGPTAGIIEYPVSDTSWAAPHAGDEGYREAYSLDAGGNPIYAEGMTDEERYAAAKQAALGYLAAAGYTVEDGRAVAAPEGASLRYACAICGGGRGDHPCYLLMERVRDALAELGMELDITDYADNGDFRDSYRSGAAAIWCAAWRTFFDPDMYPVYHSRGTSNYYHIADEKLDALILEGRQTLDLARRREIYGEAMEIVLDWAVEVPVYQRGECRLFSAERIDMDTVPANMTAYWDWTDEIERLKLKS